MGSEDVVEVEDLSSVLSAPREDNLEPTEHFPSLSHAREAFETRYIVKELHTHNGNVSKTAESLGVQRSHLYLINLNHQFQPLL